MSVNQNPKFALKGKDNIGITQLGAGGSQQVNVDDLETTVDGKVEISGDTMTGLLVLSGDPSVALGASTKQYADTKVADTGDTMTGALVIDGSADAIQLRIQGNATQTSALLVLEDSTGNDQVTVSNDGAVVINEEGNDADFRVESDGDANALYVDASANTVQVGAATASDSAKFYVAGKISASGDINANGVFKVDDTQVVTNRQAAIASLTDSTTGTPAAELVDVTTLGLCDPAKTNDNFATVNAELDKIKVALRTHGLITT